MNSEELKAMQQVAASAWTLYTSLVASGFNEKQAMEIVVAVLGHAIQTDQKQQKK